MSDRCPDSIDTRQPRSTQQSPARRDFLKSSATLAGAGLGLNVLPGHAEKADADVLRVGLVGCGGRGRGAATQALEADPHVHLVAMADVFPAHLEASVGLLRRNKTVGDRVRVAPDHLFSGFDAYEKLVNTDVDVVLLATPPQFRPIHLRCCIENGKHVFAEKPVAVDPVGVRSVLETTELAKKKNLSIVSGLNNRYSFRVQDMMKRIRDGQIGRVTALHSVRNGGGVWVKPRKPGMSDMEYQMNNWYYFTWLSGDFNVEMFVHQLDLMAWAMNDEYPTGCYSTGGRQVRTGSEYGHIYDHFSTVYEYASGPRLFTTTRHQPKCSNETSSIVIGTEGIADLGRANFGITGSNAWSPTVNPDPSDSHQMEQTAFFAALRSGHVINNGDYMAKSTMMAIIARMSAYTGKRLTWDQAMNSQLDLSPSEHSWDGTPPEDVVAQPGVTKFV